MAKVPRTVSEFIALPVSVRSPALNKDVQHYIYIKSYDPKTPSAESSRALFLVNIPVTTTEPQLRHLFTTQLSAAHVETVYFPEHNGSPASSPVPASNLIATIPTKANTKEVVTSLGKRKRPSQPSAAEVEVKLSECGLPSTTPTQFHTTGSTAIVLFLDHPSRDLAIKACRKAVKSSQSLVWSEGLDSSKQPPLGIARYTAQRKLTYPPRADLLRSVDEFMTTYAQFEEARSRDSAKKRAEPDEDGFVTVTRGSKGVVKNDEAEIIKARLEEKRKKETGLEDFYRFQMRERRRAESGQLLRRFEGEKEQVKEMRERRGMGRIASQRF